ncbi:MAG: UDP-N-acetylmuramate dehydrogenase [Nitrospirae bacterium]|uniref:UDP-N-acetylmuramate dehydrogenase n=1 Tax=Candidatus Magnetobacterium casense TaxID=1455061 RepID=UPI000698B1FC|nr:UDP-N-acetylmuramate dehydrogenase [Candidatus Magnetobacterium casensis]MBF0336380.1 UDP-N-acetylmuramate dehydrogenase [Nitrospirota bacterium]
MHVTSVSCDYSTLVRDLKGMAHYNEPMRHHTSLRIGGAAALYYEPGNLDSMATLLQRARESALPLFVIGGGSNLLFGDEDLDAVVVSTRQLCTMQWLLDDDSLTIRAGAGVPLAKALNFALKASAAGLEGLAGIPGTVGGAIAGNAGSFGFEIKDVVEDVTVITGTGALRQLTRDAIPFAYRHCGLASENLIVEAGLRLIRGDAFALKELFNDCLAQKKKSQPLTELSAGCVFKNPPGDFAGRLIEAAGCKAMAQGQIEVSRQHANFFINKARGTADDFLCLMARVQERVLARFGVELTPEIKMPVKRVAA